MVVNNKVPTSTHQNNHRTAKEALTSHEIAHATDNHIFTAQAKQVVERLKHIAPGANTWAELIPEHLRLNVKGAKLSNINKRLHPDIPSYTEMYPIFGQHP